MKARRGNEKGGTREKAQRGKTQKEDIYRGRKAETEG